MYCVGFEVAERGTENPLVIGVSPVRLIERSLPIGKDLLVFE